jgi:ABC-type lipoprotein release transport system permease subunit
MIFLMNGIYLGVAGIFFGVTLGLLVMNFLNEILEFFGVIINFFDSAVYNIMSVFVKTDAPSNIVIFSKDFYLDKIYTEISFAEIILISFLTLAFSIIASIIPAFRAGKIKPNEVIKIG